MICACERNGEPCSREAMPGDLLCDPCARYCARLARSESPFDDDGGLKP